ncbi:MAG TPA: hypothetical protein VKA95_14960 [Nitrososphaeraceae archaeon]|jgi:hypothetical protein|nr:hypothetical protein [Nitrososphaeraceae archaeon]
MKSRIITTVFIVDDENFTVLLGSIVGLLSATATLQLANAQMYGPGGLGGVGGLGSPWPGNTRLWRSWYPWRLYYIICYRTC